jgi:hypothetical protein
MANAPETIRSVEDLREQMPSILKRLNADQGLLLAALANPVFALEELGYRIPGELHRELDHRIRFSASDRQHMSELTARMHEIAGLGFDPDDPEELEQLLFKQLELPDLPPPPVRVPIPKGGMQQTGRDGSQAYAQKAHASPLPGKIPLHRLAVRYVSAGLPAEPDVLLVLRGAHPIMEPLLAYRAIAAKHAPFAPRELYERLRKGGGAIGGPTFKLRARFHRTRER